MSALRRREKVLSIDAHKHRTSESLMEMEWLETDGCGGYASSTVLNCHTRKYHGLFVANLNSPGGRFVLLSKCEESVCVGGEELHLSIHKYPMVYYPHEGHRLSEFVLHLCPRFIYRAGDVILEKEIMFVRGENTLLMRYHVNEAPFRAVLTVKPLIAYRHIHGLMHENESLRPEIREISNGFSITPYDAMPGLFMQTNKKNRFFTIAEWYRNFEYLKERDRGFSYHEDLFMPGAFECTVSPGDEIIFRVTLKEDRRRISALWRREVKRRRKLHEVIAGRAEKEDPIDIQFHLSARDFVIRNRRGKRSVVAGYHWFYEWGRDALISLPGLTFHTGRVREGVEILKNIGSLRKNGLIPNTISEEGEEGAYNSADASLWYFWCVQELLRCTGDRSLIMREFWPVMVDIATHYWRGTNDMISVLDSGLLTVGDASTQLTWMDATVNGIPQTPRHGCPVEINALWFNALCFIRHLALDTGREMPFEVDRMVEKIEEAFDAHLWIPEKEYLADRWVPDGDLRDESLRPNQIFAVSLPFSAVRDKEKAEAVVRKVTDELLTPWGLRTLSPADPAYRGKYAGSPGERDAAYHQGTVWPWLLGHYGEALLKTAADRASALKKLTAIVHNMGHHLSTAGIGHISEIFDGNPPYNPHGCVAQAWSIAEIIRLKALLER